MLLRCVYKNGLIPKDSPNDVNFQFDHLQPEPKTRMEHLLNSHNDMFATSSGELGLTSVSEHQIETQAGGTIVRASAFTSKIVGSILATDSCMTLV
jgi:hypothetical protein